MLFEDDIPGKGPLKWNPFKRDQNFIVNVAGEEKFESLVGKEKHFAKVIFCLPFNEITTAC